MKIQILHDSAGNIRGVFIPAGKREGHIRSLLPDRIVTEIDVPELKEKLTQKNQRRVVETLDRLLSSAKVVSGRLVSQEHQSYPK